MQPRSDDLPPTIVCEDCQGWLVIRTNTAGAACVVMIEKPTARTVASIRGMPSLYHHALPLAFDGYWDILASLPDTMSKLVWSLTKGLLVSNALFASLGYVDGQQGVAAQYLLGLGESDHVLSYRRNRRLMQAPPHQVLAT